MNLPAQSPLDREALIQLGFIEARGRLLDVAAFMDRVQRAPALNNAKADTQSNTLADPLQDDRMRALCEAMRIALDGKPERARRILDVWSDTTTQPSAYADGKAARGIPRLQD